MEENSQDKGFRASVLTQPEEASAAPVLTALSAGAVIYEALSEDEAVRGRVTQIFPVLVPEARLPCIAYRRAGLRADPVKMAPGLPYSTSDHVEMEILCMTEDYASGVELAECVRACLDRQRMTGESGLRIRECLLSDADETWQDDAFIQRLIFTLGI